MLVNNPKNRNTIPWEDAECELFVKDLWQLQDLGKVVKFTHHPFSTFTKSPGVKAKNTRMGVCAGFPDYTIVLKTPTGYEAIEIEMKRQKGGSTSPEQKKWHEALRLAGRQVYICKGYDEALKVIQKYL